MLEVDKDFDVCNKLETKLNIWQDTGKSSYPPSFRWWFVMVISCIIDKCILYTLWGWENFGANKKAVSWIVSWRYPGEEYVL